ncbi:MAG: exodeoxyribonuclease 7 small subunit [Minwuia thermotolerans]|nr:MAG: exodeoxyribonuclease 7 small subunit [Minwuia thermotolerans]
MTDETAMPEDIAALSFEAALAELETIVQQLESGSVDLEKSIDMYARGSLLKAHCETKLKAAEARVEKLVISPDGRPGDAVPFETD